MYESGEALYNTDTALKLAQAAAQITASILVGAIVAKHPAFKTLDSDYIYDEGHARGKQTRAYDKAGRKFLSTFASAELTSQFIDRVNESGIILDLYESARNKTR